METFSLFTILAIIVQKVVEWIRSKFPNVDSDYVRIAAVAVGTVTAWAAGINVEEVLREYGLAISDIPEWLSYLGSGAAIGFGAGAIADLLKRSGPEVEVKEEVTLTNGGVERTATATVTEHHAETEMDAFAPPVGGNFVAPPPGAD